MSTWGGPREFRHKMSICGTSSSQKDFGVTGHIGHSAPPPVPKTSPASADRKSAGPVALPGPQPKRLQRWKAFAYRFFVSRNWGFAGKSRGTLLLRNDVWVWVSHGMKRCPEKQDQTKKLDYQLWIAGRMNLEARLVTMTMPDRQESCPKLRFPLQQRFQNHPVETLVDHPTNRK